MLLSQTFFFQVNDKIHAINGQSITTMTNRQIHTALIKLNAEIIVIPSDLERKNKLCLKKTALQQRGKQIV
jgi:hypothetical protein